jgi:uncharacterized protein
MRQPIIVGIDPGTTVGYAIINLHGNVIEVNSSKLLDASKLIHLISETGIAVIVATDKKTAPGMVMTLATKLGARLVCPEEDMLVKDKADLVRPVHTHSDHERDALAAALFAWSRIRSLMNKVDIFLRENKKEHLELQMKRLLLLQDGISIKAALSLVEKPDKVERVVIEKLIEHKDTQPLYGSLLERYSRLKKELNLVRRQRDSQKLELDKLRELERPKPVPSDKKLRRVIYTKEENTRSLLRQLDALKMEIVTLDKRIRIFRDIFLDIYDYHVLKKLENLGTHEYESKRRSLRIRKGDLLLVRDGSVASEKVVASLTESVDIIVTERPSRLLSHFTIVNPKGLNITEFDGFAVVRQDAFDAAVDKQSIIEKIMREYKKGRGQ